MSPYILSKDKSFLVERSMLIRLDIFMGRRMFHLCSFCEDDKDRKPVYAAYCPEYHDERGEPHKHSAFMMCEGCEVSLCPTHAADGCLCDVDVKRKAEITALRADKEAAVLAGLGTLSLAGGGSGGVLVPASHDEDTEEKGTESNDEGTLARLATVSPQLINDGNPAYAGRKTDVYEVLINDDRSIKFDADGKFTIKKVGLFNFAFQAMFWVMKQKSGDGTLLPGCDESKGSKGLGTLGDGIFGKDHVQAQGYDAKVAKYGVLFPVKQVNEFSEMKFKFKTVAAFHVVYTTSEQYLLVKRSTTLSPRQTSNVLPAAIRN